MGGIDRNTDEEDNEWPWPPPPFSHGNIDAKSALQRQVDVLQIQVDSLEAEIIELNELIKELQKGGKDKEVDLLGRE